MIGEVDAMIIARDDYENHFKMAIPFLDAGLPVFLDKPLSLDREELLKFRPYLESGQLMSCSGLRYARELDEPRTNLTEYGQIKLVRGAVVLSWEKYGIHMLDGIFNVIRSKPLSIMYQESSHMSVTIKMDDQSVVQIDALGEVPKTFTVDVWGTKFRSTHEINDNFSMFRRTLWHFLNSIKTGKPAIPADHTLMLMKILMAGNLSKQGNREVRIDEIQL
jgi:predicted dehydrogenase